MKTPSKQDSARKRGGSVSVVLVRPLIFAIGSDEARLAEFYRATDLTAEMLADADARLSAAQFCVAWALAIELSKNPLVALDLAASIPQGAFGVVEYVCRSAPTFGEALQQWVRYLGLLDDAVDVALVAGASFGSLRVTRESEAPAPASHELCYGLIAKHGASLLGKNYRAEAVHFEHRVPKERVEAYRTFFGCEVTFGAAHTEICIPNDVLDLRLPTADPALLAILLRTADQQNEARPTERPLVDQVRRAIAEGAKQLSAGKVDADALEAVAKKLGLTARSLQRRLRDEGISFQALRDETRKNLADRYLDEGLSIAEISFLLGFSEPSAFFRAFKRWTGSTPIERMHLLKDARATA